MEGDATLRRLNREEPGHAGIEEEVSVSGPREVADPRAARARAHAEAGRWSEAAATFQDLAEDLRPLDPGAAAQCLTLAADALRREDRVAAAARCLRDALALQADGPGRALMEVELAGVLAEAGQLAPAVDLARGVLTRAREGDATPGEAALAADLLVGLCLEAGHLDLAEAVLARIPVPAARAFRAASVHRVRGRPTAAAAAVAQARAALPDRPEVAGPRAALAAEAAEQALLAGDPDAALAELAAAREGWTTARRRAGLLRVAGAEVRAHLARGQTPLTAELDRGLAYAEDRGLPLLEIELRLSRGAARARAAVSGAEDDLDRAVALAGACGAALLEGRARQARQRAGMRRQDDAARIASLLAGTAWL